MPVNFSIPFSPQEGVSQQILAAIQLANVHAAQQKQLALQQAAQPSEIAQRTAEASRLNAQTELDKMNIDLRKELIGTLMGTTPGSAPVVTQGATQNQPPLDPKDFSTGADYLQAVAAQKAQPTAPAPAAPQGGLIGQTVSNLLADPNLKPEDRQALMTAGTQARVKMLTEPQNALDSVTSTYNDILKRRGEEERKVGRNIPEAGASSGHRDDCPTAKCGEWRAISRRQ